MHLNPFERQPGFLTEMDIPSDFRMAGWVYILSNEYMPGIYKIGMTTNSPEARAKELSSATGVPIHSKLKQLFTVKIQQALKAAFTKAYQTFGLMIQESFSRMNCPN